MSQTKLSRLQRGERNLGSKSRRHDHGTFLKELVPWPGIKAIVRRSMIIVHLSEHDLATDCFRGLYPCVIFLCQMSTAIPSRSAHYTSRARSSFAVLHKLSNQSISPFFESIIIKVVGGQVNTIDIEFTTAEKSPVNRCL